MPINPDAIGAKTAPRPFEWTERDTLLYALGVGMGGQKIRQHAKAQVILTRRNRPRSV